MRILKSRSFDKFARKQAIPAAALIDAVARAERGLIDADLGGRVIKQRVAREGEGKSGGYRTLILFLSLERAVFVLGFAKNDSANISRAALAALRGIAARILALGAAGLEQQVTAGELIEVQDDENL